MKSWQSLYRWIQTPGVRQYFTKSKYILKKNQIPLTNIIACATDAAPSIIGRSSGFIALLKQQIPTCLQFTV